MIYEFVKKFNREEMPARWAYLCYVAGLRPPGQVHYTLVAPQCAVIPRQRFSHAAKWRTQSNRPYARKIKLAEFGIKKSGLKSYLENPKGKPGNPGV